MTDYIFSLKDTKIIPENIGGKAKNLCILKNNKIEIPAGFVINSNAFIEHISDLKVAEVKILDYLKSIVEINNIDETSIQKIKEIIINTPISIKLRKIINNEIKKYSSSICFAIRSSAAVEDSDKFSWAGQFESFLNVTNSINQVESAIKSVWASTFSYRSISYCIENDIISVKDMRMSVIIQEMVSNPAFSGVLFTNNLIEKNDDSLYVEFTEGYGDKLVSGTINPYKMTINRDNNASNFNKNIPIQSNLINSLKEKSLIIEKIFNKPQDIEWSITNNKIYFLQSRPITSLNINIEESVSIKLEPIIKGLPVSSGIGAGNAIIINNIHNATNIKKGEVIVAPMTNPDMVPYMRNSAAIVTDVGGMICHTAIVAREMQIPCIVGTSNATRIIKAGEIITVDGNFGIVYSGNVNIDSKQKSIPDTIDSISTLFDRSFNKNKILYYYGIGKPSNIESYKMIIVNPYFVDQQIKFQKARKISIANQNKIQDEFISNIKHIVVSSNCEINILESEIIKNYGDNKFIQENKDRIVIGKKNTPISKSIISDNISLTKFANSKNFFGHIPHIVSEGYPYPPRNGPWWPENWKYIWPNKTSNEKILWANIRPEIVNTPLTKSLIVQGVEKIPYIFNYKDLGPLYTKWKNCRMFIDINKLDDIRYKLSCNYIKNIHSFLEYIGQLHKSYNKWDYQTHKVKKEIVKNRNDIKSLINHFKSLWKIHEDFFALCFLIQTIGDDIIWPKIQSLLSEVYKIIDVKDNHTISLQMTRILASPPEKTLSRLYLEDLMNLKKEKKNINTANLKHWDLILKNHLEKWHWVRDRDLYYPPINTPEKVELLIERMEFYEPISNNFWHDVIENNTRLLTHFNLSDWFVDMIFIGNYLHIERENHHLIWVKNVDLMRDIISRIGDYLQIQNLIETKDDVFFIQLPEILKAIEDNNYSLINKDLIENRKKAFMHESKSQKIEKNQIYREIDYY